jgi:hypothetical protein
MKRDSLDGAGKSLSGSLIGLRFSHININSPLPGAMSELTKNV